jgi:hypothetical protein
MRFIINALIKLFWLGLILVVGLAVFVVLPIQPEKNELSKIGLTFSPRAARGLGLDWKEVYRSILSDLKPDVLRLPIYWNVLEPENNEYNWSEFDYQLRLLEGTGTDAILAIGHKLPRWPECHIPQWVLDSNTDLAEQALFEMVGNVVNRYKDHPNVIAYQVQNEVLFPFGECPEWSADRSRLKRLIELVKDLDPDNKVMTSDSGELSTWLKTSTLPIDALSVSLYRAVYNESHDYFYWPVNPYYYKIHAWLVSPFVDEIIISELQMEPWGPESVENLGYDDIYQSFSPLDFDDRLDFAQRTGATTVLGWGVEWWYYMDEVRNDEDYWQKAIEFFNPVLD